MAVPIARFPSRLIDEPIYGPYDGEGRPTISYINDQNVQISWTFRTNDLSGYDIEDVTDLQFHNFKGYPNIINVKKFKWNGILYRGPIIDFAEAFPEYLNTFPKCRDSSYFTIAMDNRYSVTKRVIYIGPTSYEPYYISCNIDQKYYISVIEWFLRYLKINNFKQYYTYVKMTTSNCQICKENNNKLFDQLQDLSYNIQKIVLAPVRECPLH